MRLLILVKSAPGDPEQRSATRDTYARFMTEYPGVKVLNLLGRVGHGKPDEESKLQEEKRKFCDIVQVRTGPEVKDDQRQLLCLFHVQMDFIDHYNNLTLKTVSALKFVLTSRQEHILLIFTNVICAKIQSCLLPSS